MFISPYMRKILECILKIWKGHKKDFFWEPYGRLGEYNKRLNEELHNCRDAGYYNDHYATGPADDIIAEFKAEFKYL